VTLLRPISHVYSLFSPVLLVNEKQLKIIYITLQTIERSPLRFLMCLCILPAKLDKFLLVSRRYHLSLVLFKVCVFNFIKLLNLFIVDTLINRWGRISIWLLSCSLNWKPLKKDLLHIVKKCGRCQLRKTSRIFSGY